MGQFVTFLEDIFEEKKNSGLCYQVFVEIKIKASKTSLYLKK